MSAVIVRSYLEAINEARRAYRTAHSKYMAVFNMPQASKLSWRQGRRLARRVWLKEVCDGKKAQFDELHAQFKPVLLRYMIKIGVPQEYWASFQAVPSLHGEVMVYCGGGPTGQHRDRTCLIVTLDGTWRVGRKSRPRI